MCLRLKQKKHSLSVPVTASFEIRTQIKLLCEYSRENPEKSQKIAEINAKLYEAVYLLDKEAGGLRLDGK